MFTSLLFFLSLFASAKDYKNLLSKDDAFIILNTNHGNKPITLFNYANGDSSLPMRLSALSSDAVLYQLFNVRYNFTKDFWLAPEIDTSYGSLDNNRYLISRKKPFKPNLRLKSITKDSENKLYKIVSGTKCLTVGSNVIKRGLEYWQLEFKNCDANDSNQEFMFVPKLIALSYLDRTEDVKLSKADIKRSYSTLYKVLRNFDEVLESGTI
ncbi:hypothetical protein NGRA_0519 [Nosema granulosis]|uniref:Uncharacterized protein n=1 Tax=Nosema granulosis TaxID=83296 RepID=A0A9P6H073_9MICR|nr:hypothetical protein NGRA_0519 [Nosema granulosis]